MEALLSENMKRNQKNKKLHVFQVVASLGISYVTWETSNGHAALVTEG